MSNEAELILKAFINETKNDIADFTNVTPDSLNIRNDIFYKALKELESLGYVTNIAWCDNGEALYDDIGIDTPNFKL
nr:MAG TPA: helix-turn-helix domain protein [Caudoviricetes sp.]